MSSVSMEEQQEATESLMQEMEKDNLNSFKHSDMDISQDSTSCDDSSSVNVNLQANLNSSNQQQNCKFVLFFYYYFYFFFSFSKCEMAKNNIYTLLIFFFEF